MSQLSWYKLTKENEMETGILNSCNEIASTAKRDNHYRPINCDQVSWILNAIERVMPKTTQPRVSRQFEMAKYACLYEIMEVAQLKFADKSARWNGTPDDARDYDSK